MCTPKINHCYDISYPVKIYFIYLCIHMQLFIHVGSYVVCVYLWCVYLCMHGVRVGGEELSEC